MSPWEWWAGELDQDVYDLVGGAKSREDCILEASRQMKSGEKFRIIEARSSSDRRYEGADFVPFLRTRNKEIITVGPIDIDVSGRAALRERE
ncbi:hypothetical protein BRY73_03050 [Ochrobactrum sp. P6BS-III]|uniref:hypothetical protein n=1 Tax=unclassified Ochrobactrum TaxID=239106 RepID=UPI0009918E3F|nr:hypothetical protein [Ochrobactrum sp. P6BSIII]OOL20153.1 hypothetical protein BRY73_03050 [Ochrobactrum sp. P6BS-III]